MGLRDKVNPEAAGHIQAAAAEEAILGLLLLYGEHRKAVLDSTVSLTRDSFVTAFHRNVFTVIMAIASLLAVAFFGITAILVIVAGIVVGIVYYRIESMKSSQEAAK